MAIINNFLFRKKYEEWLKSKNVSNSSLNSYCLQTKYPDTDLTFFDIIGAFAFKNEILYALAAYEKWKNEIENSNVVLKTKLNQKDYIDKYRLFIEEELFTKKESRLTTDDKKRLDLILLKLDSIKSEIKRSISTKDSIEDGIQIDGMDMLISKIGEEKFIKLAIESSYFFSKELCKKRFNEIANIWKQGGYDPMFCHLKNKSLPARFSPKSEITIDEGFQKRRKDLGVTVFKLNSSYKECIIYQDGFRKKSKNNYGGGNGNTRVCQLIKYLTGYDLGAPLERKSFKNYIISHVFGHATDPRYFTNLWNIVLVPAWANHLLDKDEPEGLSAILKATFKRVMIEYYNLEAYDWHDIDLEAPYIDNKDSDSQKHFWIKVINQKEGEPFGCINEEYI